MSEARIVVLSDEQEVARTAAQRLTEALADAISRKGEAHLALTGGSSAVKLYRELSEPRWSESVDWGHVHLWWGDERFVPIDHPESNIGMAYNMLLGAAARSNESGTTGTTTSDVAMPGAPYLPIEVRNVHPFAIDEALSESDAGQLVAQRYAEDLERLLPRGAGDLPAFDVILLGIGGDGHLMSVFPGSAAFEPDAPPVLAVPAPEHIGPHLPRVTLHPRLFEAAGMLLVMVSGQGKAEVISRILQGPHEPERLPGQLAARANALWLLDEAAADQLSPGPGSRQSRSAR